MMKHCLSQQQLKALLKRCLIVVLVTAISLGFSGTLEVSPAMAITEQELQAINQQWETSAHALNNVNCASCHQNEETKAFVANPTHESCQSCHEGSVDTFLLGKHGIRLLEEQTPLTPSMARLPMKQDALDKQMNWSASQFCRL